MKLPEADKDRGFYKYCNPDCDCTYPFSDDGIGYCWSYASYIDDPTWLKKYRNQYSSMKELCMGCELYLKAPNYDTRAGGIIPNENHR